MPRFNFADSRLRLPVFVRLPCELSGGNVRMSPGTQSWRTGAKDLDIEDCCAKRNPSRGRGLAGVSVYQNRADGTRFYTHPTSMIGRVSFLLCD